MPELTHEIRIAAPANRVWAVLSDLEAVQDYNPTVKKAAYLSDHKEGVGAGRRCDLVPGGWVTERVTAWEPQHALAMELWEHQWPIRFMRWRTELTAEGAETRVFQRMQYDMKFGAIGKLLDLLVMRRKLDRTIREVFKRLKSSIEASANA